MSSLPRLFSRSLPGAASRLCTPAALSAVARVPVTIHSSTRALSSHSSHSTGAYPGDPANSTGSLDQNWETHVLPEGEDRRTTHYLVSGATRFAYASAVRLTLIRLISTMSASADVLALGSVEVPLTNIAEGSTFTVKWRGKPVFIRHRTAAEIDTARVVEASELKDPQKDDERVQRPEWLVVLGVCTHLGCVPIANAGEYNGWFCPCHGSHYDTSGRIRKGPAPLNLEVPTYKFLSDDKLLLG